MALVVEDGTGVAGANTYIDVTFLDSYLTSRGLSVTGTKETLIHRAMDYIESHRQQFKGKKVDPAQATQWPREDAYIDRSTDPIGSDVIPVELKNAQAQAAYEADSTELMPSSTEVGVVQETVGPLTTIYGESASRPWEGPTFPRVDAWLDPLLRGGGFGIEICRV